jgi:hypothetical protein
MVANNPVASNGFILNYIDLLLHLCKPFVGNFDNYAKFIPKINCAYFLTPKVFPNADKIDLVVGGGDKRS